MMLPALCLLSRLYQANEVAIDQLNVFGLFSVHQNSHSVECSLPQDEFAIASVSSIFSVVKRFSCKRFSCKLLSADTLEDPRATPLLAAQWPPGVESRSQPLWSEERS